jgi:hypothetical protein
MLDGIYLSKEQRAKSKQAYLPLESLPMAVGGFSISNWGHEKFACVFNLIIEFAF